MQLQNPLQLNDWEVKKILKVVLIFQVVIFIVIGVDFYGFKIPILRQVISFVYLTFIPGFLILHVFNIHSINSIKNILYTVGLSITVLMLIGLFLNTAWTIFGIERPISIFPQIIGISVFVLFLSILVYLKDNNFHKTNLVDSKDILNPPVMLISLFPFIAIFGSYLMNFYNYNFVLLILLITIAFCPILVGFEKIPKKLYPSLVFVITLSLLLHRSLISMHLWGWDIQAEYYYSSIVLNNSYWDPTIPSKFNAMLAIVFLAPIYSIICDMSLTWVFKIIYPLLYSLVPFGLYYVFRKQTNDKIAFFSCFFFVSLFVFYGEMLQLARQQIAELFLILLVLLLIEDNIRKFYRAILFIVFSFSLIVSHYGTSYLFMFILIASILTKFLSNQQQIQKLAIRAQSKISDNFLFSSKNEAIGLNYVTLFVVLALGWYLYVSGSSSFNAIVDIGDHIFCSLQEGILNPEYSEALSKVIEGSAIESPLHRFTKTLHHVTQFFIIVGVLKLVLPRKCSHQFNKDYMIFTSLFLLVNFVILAIPYTRFGTTRLYHLSLFFLAPFCVIGGVEVVKAINKTAKKILSKNVVKPYKFLSILFAVFLLFNSGFVYEIAGDEPISISLNNTFDFPLFTSSEIMGVRWVEGHVDDPIYYADWYGWVLTTKYAPKHSQWCNIAHNNTDYLPPGEVFIFLRSKNVQEGVWVDKKFTPSIPYKQIYKLNETVFYKETIITSNKIYSSKLSDIYTQQR